MKQLSIKCYLMSLATILVATTAISQERKLPEAESIGVFYFLDSVNNSLLPLERQIGAGKRRGLIKGQSVVQLPGEKSTFSLKTNQKLEFVVNLPNGVDPNKYHLYLFNVRNGKREIILAESTMTGSKSNFVQVPCSITKFGGAYKYTPSQVLSPGEYGFFPTTPMTLFVLVLMRLRKRGINSPI